jgi:arsenate reductase
VKKKVKMFYNPDCSKCREAKDLIEGSGCEIEFIEYLKNIPTKKEIEDVLMRLGVKPIEIIRQKERLFQEKFLGKNFTDEEWIRIMIENPELIERPIIIDGYKAIIGRPASLIIELLERR